MKASFISRFLLLVARETRGSENTDTIHAKVDKIGADIQDEGDVTLSAMEIISKCRLGHISKEARKQTTQHMITLMIIEAEVVVTQVLPSHKEKRALFA